MPRKLIEDDGVREIDAEAFGSIDERWPSDAVWRKAEKLARKHGYDELSERWNAVVSRYAGQLRKDL